MAYNVLKGKVEGSVDQHEDQEIGGVKVFKNTVSASVFWDTDAQSPCATIKDVAITEVVSAGPDRILTFVDSKTARANYNLTFDGKCLKTKNVEAEEFYGSGKHLTDLPGNRFTEQINAGSILLGNGLHSVRGNLQVRPRDGIQVDENGVSTALHAGGALSIRDHKLTFDPSRATLITNGGQNLSDADLLVVSDQSHGNLASTTLSNLYEGYIKAKVDHPAGTLGHVQIKNKKGFTSSDKFAYDLTNETLKIGGQINTEQLKVHAALHCNGAVHQNIKTVTSRIYETQPQDYTLLCDTQNSPITVVLPPACNNVGRVINVKKASSDKYKINSYPVVVKVAEGTIDLSDETLIKTNYSSRSVQSDGENWWIISSKGT